MKPIDYFLAGFRPAIEAIRDVAVILACLKYLFGG